MQNEKFISPQQSVSKFPATRLNLLNDAVAEIVRFISHTYILCLSKR